MLMRPGQPMQAGAPGSHPVILRANSPATPGTIQDTLPPALPVQRIPNPHGYSGSTSGPGGAPMPPPGSMYSGAPGSSGAKPPTSGGPPGPPASKEAPPGGPGAHPAQRPPSGYPGPYGGPPGPRPPGPMYPEKGSSGGGGE